MSGHPLVKIRALIEYFKTIERYALHKKPKTLEEAGVMLELIAGIAREAIEEEAATPTVMPAA